MHIPKNKTWPWLLDKKQENIKLTFLWLFLFSLANYYGIYVYIHGYGYISMYMYVCAYIHIYMPSMCSEVGKTNTLENCV